MRKLTIYSYLRDKSIVDIDDNDLKYHKLIYFEGEMLKRGEGPFDFKWNRRYVILQRNTLYYYSTNNIMEEKHSIPIDLCIVSAVQDFDNQKYSFSISIVGSQRKVWFAASEKDYIERFRQQIIYICDNLFCSSQLPLIYNKPVISQNE